MCGSHELHTAESADNPSRATKGGHKRNLSAGTPENSPLRRSKRQKSSTNLRELSSSEVSEAENYVPSTPVKAIQTKKTRTPASTKKDTSLETTSVSTAERVKKEPSTKEVKSEKNDTDATAATQQVKPAKKGKKTKEQKEFEAMPLAPRTQGLRMFVGAHVSAAKGIFNSIHNSEHIG